MSTFTTTSSTTSSTTTSTHPERSRFARTPIWLVGAGAIVAGSAVTELFGATAHAIGVEMIAGSPNATPGQVSTGDYTGGVVFWGFFGVVLACALARWARTPRRTWTVTAWVLAVLSLVGPALSVGATTATQVTLGLAHLVASAVVIPILAARLDTAPGRRG